MRIITAGACENSLVYVPIHNHVKWEIILVTSGEITAIIDSKRYQLKAGDVQVIPPFVPHGVEHGGPFTDMFLSVKKLNFEKTFIVHDYCEGIRQIFPLIIKATRDRNDLSIAESLLDALLRYIIKYKGGSILQNFAPAFIDMLYDNISNANFDIVDAMKQNGFSKDHFRRRFTLEYGISPAKYLRNLRINEAKKLLYQSPYNVTEIAHQCGFSDVYYFSHCFKHQTGMTPLCYRKQSRLDDDFDQLLQSAPFIVDVKNTQTTEDENWLERFFEKDSFE